MKKPKRKMRARDKVLILLVLVIGLSVGGFELFLQYKVHDWYPENKESPVDAMATPPASRFDLA